MNLILKNKNCLITGATGGLGKEIAKQLVENECNLFLTGRNDNKLKDLKKELENSSNVKIQYFAADISNVDEINKLILEVEKTFSVDILVNCAGIFPVKMLHEYTLEDFENSFNINVKAPFLLTQKFSQDMMKSKWGRIINIASSGAYNGRKKTIVYRSTKHALLGLSRSVHAELKEHNIRTFCISPGPIKTSMGKEIIKNEDPNADYESFMNPSDIAKFTIHVISYNNEMISEEVRLSRIN